MTECAGLGLTGADRDAPRAMTGRVEGCLRADVLRRSHSCSGQRFVDEIHGNAPRVSVVDHHVGGRYGDRLGVPGLRGHVSHAALPNAPASRPLTPISALVRLATSMRRTAS